MKLSCIRIDCDTDFYHGNVCKIYKDGFAECYPCESIIVSPHTEHDAWYILGKWLVNESILSDLGPALVPS